jgi:hypothetical protein
MIADAKLGGLFVFAKECFLFFNHACFLGLAVKQCVLCIQEGPFPECPDAAGTGKRDRKV